MDHSLRAHRLRSASEATTGWSKRPAAPGRRPEGGRVAHPGIPLTFGGTVGIFHPGSAAVAVLMLSPVGYEEMCCRTTWRSLAEAIAAAGIPCLRFDYPGTGDALDPAAAPDGIADWLRAAAEAAALLRARTGAERLILVGQGLGAALAAKVAPAVGPLDACAYLAPVVDGRRHVRELAMWGRMITDRIGIGPDPDDRGGCSVAGFGLESARVEAIRELSLLRPGAVPAVPSLVVARPDRAADANFASHLAGLGVAVTTISYDGYDKLAADPSVAVPPAGTLAAVVSWLSARRAAVPGHRDAGRGWAAGVDAAASIHGDGFAERPLRFGPGGRLFGVLCRPTRPAAGRSVVFVGSGRDPHVGPGRGTVLQARAFAALGIASLRFDPGGIGDSPAASDDGAEVLYSQGQIDDVRAAVDLMEASGFASPTLIGRCSGAHAAFHAAVRDERVGRLVMLNLSRFVWDPAEDVSESLRYAHRRLGDFGAVLVRGDGMRRLLTGRLRVGAAGRHLLRRWLSDAGLRLAPVLGGLTHQGRARRAVRRGMDALAARGVPVALVYSPDDPGLAELARHFGGSGRGLRAYPNAFVEHVPDADHNFTHAGARARLLALLARILGP